MALQQIRVRLEARKTFSRVTAGGNDLMLLMPIAHSLSLR